MLREWLIVLGPANDRCWNPGRSTRDGHREALSYRHQLRVYRHPRPLLCTHSPTHTVPILRRIFFRGRARNFCLRGGEAKYTAYLSTTNNLNQQERKVPTDSRVYKPQTLNYPTVSKSFLYSNVFSLSRTKLREVVNQCIKKPSTNIYSKKFKIPVVFLQNSISQNSFVHQIQSINVNLTCI